MMSIYGGYGFPNSWFLFPKLPINSMNYYFFQLNCKQNKKQAENPVSSILGPVRVQSLGKYDKMILPDGFIDLIVLNYLFQFNPQVEKSENVAFSHF